MSTKAKSGFGTTLKYAAGTLVGELTSIGGFKLKADSIEVTNHNSPNGYKEFINSLKDAGEFPIEGNFIQDDAGQLAVMASFASGAAESFIVTFPDNSEWAFTGNVTGIEIGKADVKGQITFGASIKISGAPVFTGVTTLRTVTFTVTAAAGGAAVSGAVIVFNGETKTTGSTGILVFSNVADGDKTYGITKTGMVGQAKVITVNGTEAEAVSLVAA
jgi:predicted secreted protein